MTTFKITHFGTLIVEDQSFSLETGAHGYNFHDIAQQCCCAFIHFVNMKN